MKTLYQILEVSETASDEVIEKAYKVLVKKYHPDLQPEGKKQAAEQTMKKLNEAYDILCDPIKRKEYDEKLALQRKKEEAEQNNLNQTTNSYSNSYAQNNENNQQYNEQYQRQYHEQNQEQYKEQYQRQYEKQYYQAKRQAEQRARQEEARRKQNAMNAEQKMQEELRKSYEAQYQNAYENYLRSLGYKIKHKWTLKNYKEFFLSILILAVICLILWLFPPTHEWLVDFYNSNAIIKIIIDVIGKILTVIWNTLKSFFGKS